MFGILTGIKKDKTTYQFKEIDIIRAQIELTFQSHTTPHPELSAEIKSEIENAIMKQLPGQVANLVAKEFAEKHAAEILAALSVDEVVKAVTIHIAKTMTGWRPGYL